jgi:formate dehydrogenase major subunit
VIVTEGLAERGLRARALRPAEFEQPGRVHRAPRTRPRRLEAITGVPAARCAAPRALRHRRGNGAIYYGLGVTEHSQGSTMVMGIANLAMAPATSAARASA